MRTLKGIFNYQADCFGKQYWLGMTNGKWADEECKQKTKVAVKTSNSVYYANSLSSIYIPEMQSPITNEVRIEIDNMLDSGNFTTSSGIVFWMLIICPTCSFVKLPLSSMLSISILTSFVIGLCISGM